MHNSQPGEGRDPGEIHQHPIKPWLAAQSCALHKTPAYRSSKVYRATAHTHIYIRTQFFFSVLCDRGSRSSFFLTLSRILRIQARVKREEGCGATGSLREMPRDSRPSVETGTRLKARFFSDSTDLLFAHEPGSVLQENLEACASGARCLWMERRRSSRQVCGKFLL